MSDADGAIEAARDAARGAERGGQLGVAVWAWDQAERLGDTHAAAALAKLAEAGVQAVR